MNRTTEQDLIEASGTFLTERLPVGFKEWESQELEQYIGDYMCEVYERMDASEVYELIECDAQCLSIYIENATKGLVQLLKYSLLDLKWAKTELQIEDDSDEGIIETIKEIESLFKSKGITL